MSEPENLDGSVDHELCEVFAEAGELVTKWVTVLEVVDAEGRRWLRTLSSEGLATWDSMGMLTQALTTEQAAVAGALAP